MSPYGTSIHEIPPSAPSSPSAPTSDERIAALIAHGGTFFAWTLAPLLVFVLKRNDSKYVETQALQALLWSLAGTLLAAATCGLAIPFFMIFHGIAAWKSLEGEHYEYPLVGDLARTLLARR